MWFCVMYGQKLDVRQSQNAKRQDRIWAEMVGLGPGTTRRWVLGWLRCSNFNSIPLPDWDCGQTNCCQVTLELNALYRCYQKTAPRHLLCLPLLVSKYLGVTLNTNNTVFNPPHHHFLRTWRKDSFYSITSLDSRDVHSAKLPPFLSGSPPIWQVLQMN